MQKQMKRYRRREGWDGTASRRLPKYNAVLDQHCAVTKLPRFLRYYQKQLSSQVRQGDGAVERAERIYAELSRKANHLPSGGNWKSSMEVVKQERASRATLGGVRSEEGGGGVSPGQREGLPDIKAGSRGARKGRTRKRPGAGPGTGSEAAAGGTDAARRRKKRPSPTKGDSRSRATGGGTGGGTSGGGSSSGSGGKKPAGRGSGGAAGRSGRGDVKLPEAPGARPGGTRGAAPARRRQQAKGSRDKDRRRGEAPCKPGMPQPPQMPPRLGAGRPAASPASPASPQTSSPQASSSQVSLPQIQSPADDIRVEGGGGKTVAAGKEVVEIEKKKADVAGAETEKEEEEEEDYSDDDFDDDDFEDDDEEEEEAAAAEEKKDATGTAVEKATKVEAASPDDGTETALAASPAVAASALAATTADSPAGQEQPPAQEQPAAVDVDIVAVLRATLSLDGIPKSTACLERSSGDAELLRSSLGPFTELLTRWNANNKQQGDPAALREVFGSIGPRETKALGRWAALLAELVEALPLGQSIGRADEYVGQDGRPTAMSVAHDAATMFARCLVWCIESEVLPMVTQVEALLSDADVFNGVSWADMGVGDLAAAIEEGCGRGSVRKLPEVRGSKSMATGATAMLRQLLRPSVPSDKSASMRHLLLPGPDMCCPSVNRLLSRLRPGLLEGGGSAKAKFGHVRRIEKALGLFDTAKETHVLDSATKGTLLTLSTSADPVPRRLQLVARRGQALDDLTHCVSKLCRGSTKDNPLPKLLLFPAFLRDPGADSLSRSGVEEGEGHGPRKEFFEHAAAQAAESWADSEGGVRLEVMDQYGEAVRITLRAGDREFSLPKGAQFEPLLTKGCELILTRGTGSGGNGDGEHNRIDRHVVASVVGGAGGGGGSSGRGVGSGSGNGNDKVVTVKLERPFEHDHELTSDTPACCRRPVTPILLYHKPSQSYFLNRTVKQSDTGEERLRMLGYLFASAVVNRCTLGLNIAPMLFHLLIGGGGGSSCLESESRTGLSLEDLRVFDPALWASMSSVFSMDDANFQALAEAEDLENLVISAGPAGAAGAGAGGSAGRDYALRAMVIDRVLHDRLLGGLEWQVTAMRQGFAAIVQQEWVRTLQYSALQLHDTVCGPSSTEDLIGSIDFREHFHVILDDEFETFPEFEGSFWDVVHSFTADQRRQWLKFVTGSSNLPAAKAECLRIELPFMPITEQDYRTNLLTVPRSHTCTNSLELPNYLESVMHLHKNEPSMTPAMINAKVHAVLLEKMVIAIANGGEYGLDEPVVQVADNRDSLSARSDTSSSAASDSDSDSDRRPRPTNTANSNNNNSNGGGDGVMAFDDESSGDSLDIPMLGGGGDGGDAKSAAVVPKQAPSAPPPTQAASPNEDSYGDDFESDFETDEDA